MQMGWNRLVNKGLHLLVRVSGNLVANHHTVHQPLGQEPGVVMAELHGGQLPQVLTLQQQLEMCSRPRYG